MIQSEWRMKNSPCKGDKAHHLSQNKVYSKKYLQVEHLYRFTQSRVLVGPGKVISTSALLSHGMRSMYLNLLRYTATSVLNTAWYVTK